MDWTHHQKPRPVIRSEIQVGNVVLSVSTQADTDKRWQFFCFSFGKYSGATHAECLSSWPREALRLARAELDALESKINAE